jgi:pimeloyl-ACP methyl ester carboxylesterase
MSSTDGRGGTGTVDGGRPVFGSAARVFTEFAVAPLRVATAAVTGWTDYVSAYLSPAGPHPLGPDTPLRVADDVLAWWQLRTTRERPRWAHPAPVVRQWPLARLRDYSTGETPVDPEHPEHPEQVPTLVLPPQAGHDSCIVDFAPGQSQLLTLREAGLHRLYCLDWAGATEQTADCSIEDYLALLADTVELLGGRVNLVGDCQGGWLAVIYAALHPEQVNTLTIAGAPVDCHAGGSTIRDWTGLFGRAGTLGGPGPMAPYEAMVALGGGVQRGANQLLGFKLLEPAAEWQRELALLGHIRDPEYVARHVEFTNWFEWVQDIPGAFYLWIVEHLFQNNELAEGTLTISGHRVDLGRIDCPLFLIAGRGDHITPPEQVWALAERVGTPAGAVHRELVEAGHLGLFMGREPLRGHWAPIMGRVRELSGG